MARAGKHHWSDVEGSGGRLSRLLWALAGLTICVGTLVQAQGELATTHLVTVDGRNMRVRTQGLETRRSGQPLIVLEAGAGEGLDNWTPVFAQMARLGPVVAYDRRGIGQSEPDVVRPSLRRVAQSLHALLGALDEPPPYLIVGHSWGGLFTWAFSDQYAAELAGLVFLDVTDFETTQEEKVAAVAPEDRERVLAPPTIPPIPPDTPPGLRAEYEVVASEMLGNYPEARTLNRRSAVPVAVIVATPSARMQGLSGEMVNLQMKHQAQWALSSPNGQFMSADVGHMVHRDDPALVVRVVERLLMNRPAPAGR